MTTWSPPLLCLVTDRRRIAGGDLTVAAETRALIAQIAEAAENGIDLIQIREADMAARDLHALVSAAVAVTRGSSSRVVVNDRADVALSAGADGVHLSAAGPDVARVRAMGPPDWIVGRSAHSQAELAAVSSADYAVFGTVFPTSSKPGIPGQGVAPLAAAAGAVTTPVLAIGGITLERIRACRLAGASGIAAISLFLPEAFGGLGPGPAARRLRERFNED